MNAVNAALAQLSEEIAHLSETLRRSTVQVRTTSGGAGAGVIWRPDGLIVTNAHVVLGSSAIVELADGRTFEATVSQRDDLPGRSRRDRRWNRDLTALRIAATNLPAASIAPVDELRVGDLVFAIGHPLGQIGAVTMGIVHSQSQQPWIQADIRLAPGNSGGPLVDAQGRVVGLNTMIINGLGFAIPSAAIAAFLQGESRPRLGLTLQPVLMSRFGQRLGLLVLRVASDSPAAERLQVGDVLIGVEGWPLRDVNDLTQTLSSKRSGDSIRLDFWRAGERQSQTIVLNQTGGMQAA